MKRVFVLLCKLNYSQGAIRKAKAMHEKGAVSVWLGKTHWRSSNSPFRLPKGLYVYKVQQSAILVVI